MAAIEEWTVDPGWRLPAGWDAVAEGAAAWLARRRLTVRDAVVLLPFTALLAPLREAFARRGGWQPRVETVRTLAAALSPPPPAAVGACSGDIVADRLAAAALLRAHAVGAAWVRRDPVGFERVVADVAAAAQTLCARAAALPPATRDAFFDRARREAAARPDDGAATEAALLRVALEWAAVSMPAAPPATDAVHALVPSAWILVRIGGSDPLADGVAEGAAAVPSLRLWLDPQGEVPPRLPAAAGSEWKPSAMAGSGDLEPAAARSDRRALASDGSGRPEGPPRAPGSGAAATPPALEATPSDDGAAPLAPELLPFAAACRAADVERFVCEGFEAETQAAACVVIDALNAGRAPVALVALDRELVRRVRALLERRGVAVIDETGWVLSTTRAGATVRALLRAASPGAGRDDWLEWLKSSAAARGDALDRLEALWRGRRIDGDTEAAQALAHTERLRLKPLADAAPQPLQGWLALLRDALAEDGTAQALADDDAGAQVLQALRLDGHAPPHWDETAAGPAMTLPAFSTWVASTLEATLYRPPADAAAQVVLTPLGRIGGRAFAHTVVAGADHRHLGPVETPAQLIGEPLAAALGLADAVRRRWEQRLALGLLLRSGRVTFLRRLRDDDQALSDSPDVLWLAAQAAPVGSGAGWPARVWVAPTAEVAPRPVVAPLPVAAGALPRRLSASRLELLRQCPYRFFARAVLRLDEPEELDAGLDKREYGTWLHAVLHRFHSDRDHRGDAAAQLQAAAAAVTREQRLDAGELLPFRASFDRFAPDYLAWLDEREARGWHWSDGESDHTVAPAMLDGLVLQGRLDRLDHGPSGRRQLIDYKTGSAGGLKDRMRDPLEDTQLAFYALLLGGGEPDADEDGALDAAYLALDDAEAPLEIAHKDVPQTASRLLAGLAHDWRRLRDGHPLPALGQPPVCDHCEARGLCRRDHWAPPAAAATA